MYGHDPESIGKKLRACRLELLSMLCLLPDISGSHSGCASADEQIIISDLDDLDGAADDDDEPMIVKVETARQREQTIAAKAQQELSRLQKQQLQAKFDLANHRKAQVRQSSTQIGLSSPILSPPCPPPACLLRPPPLRRSHLFQPLLSFSLSFTPPSPPCLFFIAPPPPLPAYLSSLHRV